MELWVAAIATVQLLSIGAAVGGFIRASRRIDQEIRERQGANNSTGILVARQGRALSEHVESNLHR